MAKKVNINPNGDQQNALFSFEYHPEALLGISNQEKKIKDQRKILAEEEYNRKVWEETVHRGDPDWLLERAKYLESKGFKLSAYCFREEAKRIKEKQNDGSAVPEGNDSNLSGTFDRGEGSDDRTEPTYLPPQSAT